MAAAAVRRSQLYRDERDLWEAQGRTTAQAEAVWDDTGHKALCPVSLSRSGHTIGGVPVIL